MSMYPTNVVGEGTKNGKQLLPFQGSSGFRRLDLSYRSDGVRVGGESMEIGFGSVIGDGERSVRLPAGSYRAAVSDKTDTAAVDVEIAADQETRYLIDWSNL